MTLFLVGYLDTIGKRLRAARLGAFERLGREVTQGEVAAAAGVKANAANAWENDVSPPSIEAVRVIAPLLGVTPGWLAFGQGPRYPTQPEPPEAPVPTTPISPALTEEERARAKKAGSKRRARGGE